jgi:membrane-bound ClpP family serine protease
MTGDMTNATKEIIDALKPLEIKLGESAQQVYNLAIKDVIIDGRLELVGAIVAGVLLIVGIWSIFYGIFSKTTGNAEGFIGSGALLSAFSGFWGGMALVSCIHNLCNPEYMALLDLLQHIK